MIERMSDAQPNDGLLLSVPKRNGVLTSFNKLVLCVCFVYFRPSHTPPQSMCKYFHFCTEYVLHTTNIRIYIVWCWMIKRIEKRLLCFISICSFSWVMEHLFLLLGLWHSTSLKLQRKAGSEWRNGCAWRSSFGIKEDSMMMLHAHLNDLFAFPFPLDALFFALSKSLLIWWDGPSNHFTGKFSYLSSIALMNIQT